MMNPANGGAQDVDTVVIDLTDKSERTHEDNVVALTGDEATEATG